MIGVWWRVVELDPAALKAVAKELDEIAGGLEWAVRGADRHVAADEASAGQFPAGGR